MAITDSIPKDGLFLLKNAKEGRPLSIMRGRFSEPIPPFDHVQPLTFGVAGPVVDGQASYRVIAQATWPEGTAQEVAVFLAAVSQGAGTKITALAIENGPRVFPPRSLRSLNFSGQKLFAQVDSFRGDVPIGPGRAIPYPEVKTEPGRTGRFRVGVGRLDEVGGPQILFSGWVDAWPNSRTLMLITPPSSGSNKPEVRFIVDNLPPPPPESKATR